MGILLLLREENFYMEYCLDSSCSTFNPQETSVRCHKEYGNVLPEYKDIYVKVKNINIKNLKDTEFIPKNN